MSNDAVPGLARDAPSGDGARSGRPRRPPRRRRTLPRLLVVVVVVAALIGGAIYAVGKIVGPLSKHAPADYPGAGEGSVIVQVTPNSTASDIATALARDGVVKSAGAFVDAAAADERSRTLQPGWYRMRSQMSAAAALDLLLDPSAHAQFTVTIAEGTTARRLLQLLADKTGTPLARYEQAARDTRSLGLPSYAAGTVEGLLYPSSYDLPPKIAPTQALRMLVERFVGVATDLDLVRGAGRIGRTPEQILTVASILEREVRNDADRAKVARVIYNRLADRTGRYRLLDMDSTTRYAVGNFDRPLTPGELEFGSPYNTRVSPGLPPGPICNPGESALGAALNPTPGPWKYFLSLPRSRVNLFATTTAEWNAIQARYRAEGG